jgi:hypothetical protein
VELSIVSRETVITYAQLGGDERVGLSSFEARPDASDLSLSSAGRESPEQKPSTANIFFVNSLTSQVHPHLLNLLTETRND